MKEGRGSMSGKTTGCGTKVKRTGRRAAYAGNRPYSNRMRKKDVPGKKGKRKLYMAGRDRKEAAVESRYPIS